MDRDAGRARSDYIPITTEDAVTAINNGAWLLHAEIPDLGALISAGKAGGAKLRFHNCRILKSNCSGLHVAHELHFPNTLFTEIANFANTTFMEPTHFDNTTFRVGADFSSATFKRYAGIFSAAFIQTVNFSSATFDEQATFLHAKFECIAAFASATFRRGAGFADAVFTWTPQFPVARFMQSASFERATFAQGANFSSIIIGGRLRFAEATIAETARLDFHDADLRPGGSIGLTIDQIGRRGRHLIRGEDSREPLEMAKAAAQYNMLRDTFRAMPSTDEEEDRCHYKYMDLRRRASTPPSNGPRNRLRWAWYWFNRLSDWLLFKWFYDYGIYTHRILATIVLVILGFAALYQFAAGPETIQNYYVQSSHPAAVDAERATEFSPLYFSLITFTTIGYGDYAPRAYLRWVAGAEGLLGLLLMAIFTVSFARKFIR